MDLVNARGKNYGVKHLLAPKSGPLISILNETLGLSEQDCHFLLQFGSIYHNDGRISKAEPVKEGDYIRVHTLPRRFPSESIQWPNCAIEDNNEFVIINKPAGLPVHPTVDNTQENILAILSQKMGKELFVTHRLDVATSGLMLLAKSKEYQKKFNDFLMQSQVRKIYRAVTHGHYKSASELVHYMEPSPRAPKKLSAYQQLHWQQCRLNILDVNHFANNTSEIKCELITGRTHQIRSQLSFEGHPIIGDEMYGSTQKILDQKGEAIALQACYLSFPEHQFKLDQFTYPDLNQN